MVQSTTPHHSSSNLDSITDRVNKENTFFSSYFRKYNLFPEKHSQVMRWSWSQLTFCCLNQSVCINCQGLFLISIFLLNICHLCVHYFVLIFGPMPVTHHVSSPNHLVIESFISSDIIKKCNTKQVCTYTTIQTI